MNWLVQVGGLAELVDRHWLLLDVVLREQSRLACHHLLNGSRNHQIIDVVVCLPGFPTFRRNNLQQENTSGVILVLLGYQLHFSNHSTCFNVVIILSTKGSHCTGRLFNYCHRNILLNLLSDMWMCNYVDILSNITKRSLAASIHSAAHCRH